jgi:transposase-like protein
MPSKAKKVDRDVAKLPSIPKELVNLFMTGPMTGEAINDAGIAFKKALVEASLNAELSHHLGEAAKGSSGEAGGIADEGMRRGRANLTRPPTIATAAPPRPC